MEEIGEVVRLIPQERVQQRTVIDDAHVPQVVEGMVDVVQIKENDASVTRLPGNDENSKKSPISEEEKLF